MSDKASRKELVEKYKEMKTRYGVYQIKNKANGKIYIGSAKNLRAKGNSYMSFVENNPVNKEITEDYKRFGKDCFEFSVLEEEEVPDDSLFDLPKALEKMLDKWLAQLEPYNEKGYNKRQG